MFNPKVIAVSAVVGFILSFFVGLFSGVSFGYVLLRALISAILFGVLGFSLDFILKKFVNVEATTNDISDQKRETGNLVDITIDDDVLKEDESGPSFFVDSKNIGKTENLDEAFEDSSEETQPNENFKTVNLAKEEFKSNDSVDTIKESNDFIEPAQKSSKIDSLPTSPQTNSVSMDSDDLEDLPDISGFVGGTTIEEEEKPVEKLNVSLSESDVKDSSVMAQAIRTVLLKDG